MCTVYTQPSYTYTHVHIHTPLQASLEELMEGTGAASLTVYDEAALCSSAFKILRGLVHTWLNEVSTHQNHYADLQLQHFYR